MKKVKISESQYKGYIMEAMDDDFSFDELKSLQKFKEKVDYCTRHLGDAIGKGSSRIVFQLDDEKVIKLAFNQKGIAQNEAECDWGMQNYNVVPKIFDESDTDEYSYIVSEFVLPAKPMDFKKILGIDFKTFQNFIAACNNLYCRKRLHTSIDSNTLKEMCESNQQLNNMMSMLCDYGLPAYDLTKLRNLGLSNYGGKPRIVFLDTGFTESVGERFYKRW